MRDLTREELKEYFDFAEDDRRAGDFNQQQTFLVGEAVTQANLLVRIGPKVLAGLALGYNEKDLILSLWVSAFQMGRECESRLMTKALKGNGRK